MRTPDVSVVVPTHDVGAWIDECLTSLLVDQDVDLEVVVIDDASSDDTVERAQAWARRDDRLRVLHNPGVGGGQARNYGVAVTTGEYLVFVDGDDIVPAGAYRAMLDAARASGSDLVVGDFLKFSATQTWSPTARWPLFREPARGTTLAACPSLVRNRACWNRLFRRDFWVSAAIAYPSVPRSNDIVPMVTALTAARTIDVVQDIVYLYRARPGGTSMTARAGIEAGTASYFTQELVCAELVGGVPDAPELERTYWSMVLGSDGWVHVRRFVRERAHEPGPSDAAPSQVPGLVTQLLEHRDPGAWGRLAPERQLVYALTALGRVEWAGQVLDAIGEEDVPPVPMAPATALAAIEEAVGSALVGEDSARLLAQRLVLDGMATGGWTPDEADARTLAALARQHPRWFSTPVSEVERPVHAQVRRALTEGDIAALMQPRPVGEPLQVRGGVLHDRGLDLVLVSPSDAGPQTAPRVRAWAPGRPESLTDVADIDTSRSSWQVTVRAKSLPQDGRWNLEAVYDTPAGRVQVPLELRRADVVVRRHRWGRIVLRGRRSGTVPLVVQRVPAPGRRLVRGLRRHGVRTLLRLPGLRSS